MPGWLISSTMSLRTPLPLSPGSSFPDSSFSPGRAPLQTVIWLPATPGLHTSSCPSRGRGSQLGSAPRRERKLLPQKSWQTSLLVTKLVHITIPESHNSRGWDSIGQRYLLHVRPVRGGESCLFQSTQAAQVAVETSTQLYQEKGPTNGICHLLAKLILCILPFSLSVLFLRSIHLV